MGGASDGAVAVRKPQIEALTPEAVNNHIVRMRGVVEKARVYAIQSLVRKIRQLEKKSERKNAEESNESESTKPANPKRERKADRYKEEIVAMRKLQKDDVSKFALINQKTLAELNIIDETPADQRALYKLATAKMIVKAVEEWRLYHPGWEAGTAFILQRLGKQYESKKIKPQRKRKVSESVDDDSEAEKSTEPRVAARVTKSRPEVTDRPPLKKLVEEKREKPSLKKIVESGNSTKETEGDEPAKTNEKKKKSRKEKSQPKDVKGLLRKTIIETAKKEKIVKKKKGVRSVEAPIQLKVPNVDAVLGPKGKKVVGQVLVKRLHLDSDDDDSEEEEEPREAVIQPAASGNSNQASAEEEDDTGDFGSFFIPVSGSGPKAKRARREEEENNFVFPSAADKKKKNDTRGSEPSKRKNLKPTPFKAKGQSQAQKKTETEELHPSWIAKKREQELRQAKPQGKKTVFDDED